MTRRMTLCVLLAGIGLCGSASAGEQEKARPHKTDWMYNARWGVMYHFSSGQRPGAIKTKADWDKVVSEFDVEGLAGQLHELGAGYLILTSYHYGHGVAKSRTIDDGTFPKRDLIADLADALGKHGIRLVLYYPTGMGISMEAAKTAAGRIAELSKRYGKKVSGWWLDNSMPGETEKQKMMAVAARSGNADALVAMSKGDSPFDDYTSNNEHAPGTASCRGRFMQGRQWHILTYLGHNWGGLTKYGGRPRFSAAKASWITARLVDGGGVVTWDVPWEMNGLPARECMPVLQAIGKAAREAKRETREARGLPKKRPPHKTDWLHDARWGMFYLFGAGARNAKEMESAVRAFDVPTLVKALKDVGAGYFMISAHTTESGVPIAPIASYAGKTPSRDLVGEIANALAAEKIPLMLYFATRDHAGAPAAVRELSLRYGRKVRGWYLAAGTEYKALAEAARAGNPDALLTIPAGPGGGELGHPHIRHCEFEDFTGGRTSTPGAMSCPKRFVADGLQWHTMGTFGFSKYQRRYDAARAAEITGRHLLAGGVITWLTPHTPTGAINPGWLASVRAAGKRAKDLVRNEPPEETEAIRNPTPPDAPKGALAVTCTHTLARAISAKQDWWPERQEGLGLLIGVGKRHSHFVRSQLVFDLSKVDKTRPVALAVLSLYMRNGPVGEATEQCNHVEFHRWTRKIEPRDQRWYNAPYAREGGKLWKVTKKGPIEVDVTEIVRAWMTGQPNYGFRLSAPGLGGEWQRYGVTWRSFEAKPYDAANSPNGPRLIVYQTPKK